MVSFTIRAEMTVHLMCGGLHLQVFYLEVDIYLFSLVDKVSCTLVYETTSILLFALPLHSLYVNQSSITEFAPAELVIVSPGTSYFRFQQS